MDDASTPPPSSTLLAAAVGAFGGALLGVAAGAMLLGDGDGNGDSANGQAAIDAIDSQAVELVVTEG